MPGSLDGSHAVQDIANLADAGNGDETHEYIETIAAAELMAKRAQQGRRGLCRRAPPPFKFFNVRWSRTDITKLQF